jgi:hypothetical protein
MRICRLVNLIIGLEQSITTLYQLVGTALIHSFDNYVNWPGSLALMNCEPITLRNLLMRARFQDQKESVT